jgi:hypothetical protein
VTGVVNLEMFLEAVRTGGTLGLLLLAAQLFVQNRKLKVDARTSDRKADLDLEVHRDSLTFQLLEAARSEIQQLRLEVERRRLGEEHIRHFDDALVHIEALLLAENDTDRKAAERQARAFLNRMRRMQEARGIIANEIQRIESEQALNERAAQGGEA